MTPVEPTLHEGAHLCVFGTRQQDDYIPLPASVDDNGLVMSEWQPSNDELQRLLCGGRIRLWVWTFEKNIGTPEAPLQPVRVEVVDPTAVIHES